MRLGLTGGGSGAPLLCETGVGIARRDGSRDVVRQGDEGVEHDLKQGIRLKFPLGRTLPREGDVGERPDKSEAKRLPKPGPVEMHVWTQRHLAKREPSNLRRGDAQCCATCNEALL
eukprot:scaffold7210_cov32-Tisochrysis_lutea.AAC.3